jgi:hypothetical protein
MIEELPEALATLDDRKCTNKVERLCARDAWLWTNADEGQWLGAS